MTVGFRLVSAMAPAEQDVDAIALQEAGGLRFVAQHLDVVRRAIMNREAPKQWDLDGFSQV